MNKTQLKDAIEFLEGEQSQVILLDDEDELEKYIKSNGLDEEDYDYNQFLDNTYAHVLDQLEHRRGYDKDLVVILFAYIESRSDTPLSDLLLDLITFLEYIEKEV